MHASLIRFVVVGGLNTAIAYVVFTGLVGAGLHYQLASVVSWALGIGSGFLMHRYLTFAVRTPVQLQEGGAYLVGALVQLAAASLGYAVLIDAFGLSAGAAFAGNLVFVSTVNFLYLRRWVFRSSMVAPLTAP